MKQKTQRIRKDPKETKIVEKAKKQELLIANAKEAETRIRTILKEFAKLNDQERREEFLEDLDKIVEKSTNYSDFERLSILLVDIPIRI